METTTRVHSPVSCGQSRPPMRTERYVPPNMDENEALKHGANVCVVSVWTHRKGLAAVQGTSEWRSRLKTGALLLHDILQPQLALFCRPWRQRSPRWGASDTLALFQSHHISFTAAELLSSAAFPGSLIRCSLRCWISSRLSARSRADGVLLLYGNCCKTCPDDSGWGGPLPTRSWYRVTGHMLMVQSDKIFQRP